MAEKLDPKQTVDIKELIMSGVIQSEALINVLDRKGIVSKAGTPGRNEKGSGVDGQIRDLTSSPA